MGLAATLLFLLATACLADRRDSEGAGLSSAAATLLLNLSVSARRSNVAERDGLGRAPLIPVTANAQGAPLGHFVGIAIAPYALFHRTGVRDLSPPESFTLVELISGVGTAGTRCSGNTGTAELIGFLVDARGRPVGEASASFECFLDDPARPAPRQRRPVPIAVHLP